MNNSLKMDSWNKQPQNNENEWLGSHEKVFCIFGHKRDVNKNNFEIPSYSTKKMAILKDSNSYKS